MTFRTDEYVMLGLSFTLRFNAIPRSDGYDPAIQAGVRRFNEMSRAEARTAFKEIVATVPERRAALEQLATLNGYANDPAGWTRMCDKHAESVDHELTELWRSVAFDVSVTLSDMLIERGDGAITWKFYAGSKKSLDYHQPVLVGFTNVTAKYYHWAFQHPFSNMVLKAAGGAGMRDLTDYFEYIAEDV